MVLFYEPTMPEGPIILFDGVCCLCDGAVRFVLARDRRAIFKFAPFQSAAGERLMKEHDADSNDLNSVMLIMDGIVYRKSGAALRIAGKLDGLWPVFKALLLVPRPIRDWVYDVIARHRYRWFGKKDACALPSAERRGRFLG